MHSEPHELEEGKVYPFKILKYVEQTGSAPFWIMLDPLGQRHILRAKHYTDYGFAAEQTINVYIPYISCTGKITLEPEHPVYKIGSIHDFPFLKHDIRINQKGEEQKVLVAADLYGREIAVNPISDAQLKADFCPKSLKCKVIGLKDSQLLLEQIKDKNKAI